MDNKEDPNSDKSFVCKETFWWDGFEIIPPRPKLGLLRAFADRGIEADTSDESTEEETEEEDSSSSVSTDSGEGSAESNPQPKATMRKKPRRLKESNLWQHNMSVRANQDNQRAYEEKAVKLIMAHLNKNTLYDKPQNSNRSISRNTTPLGGVWVRLEAEWKESFTQGSSQQKSRNVVAGKYPGKSRGK